MVIFLRHSFVSFLILLQFAAPLLHAHTGDELTNDGIHIPGLEVIASQHPDSTSFEAIKAYEVSGIIVDISSGIKRLNILPDKNLQTSHVSGDRLPILNHRKSVMVYEFYSFSPLPEPSVLVHSPRAPPY
jgi:hypothetical protein